MFNCFVVRDRNFLRFLRYHNHDIDGEYRMCVHVFGNSPSPSVAIYGLRRAAMEGERDYGSEARRFVERNFYVDDGLVSLPKEEESITLLQNAQDMLALSNLRLHKILSNRVNIMRAFPLEDLAKGSKDLDLNADLPPMQRNLGVSWDISEDMFTFKVSEAEKPYTRRGVLSTVNSLFDPLGFAAPVSIQGRSLLRELTSDTCDWDKPLSQRRSKENGGCGRTGSRIPRQYTSVCLNQAQSKELCVFCDASTTSISAVAYLGTIDLSNNTNVGFVLGKAKLAPRPDITVPRLELCAAVLAIEIVDEMDVVFDAVTFYSDSKVVLGYIHNKSRRFYVYVNNRVQRIRESTSPEEWKYVPTSENPADHASRSVPAGSLTHTTWQSGPVFLFESAGRATSPTSFVLVDPSSDVDIRPQVTCRTTKVTTSDVLDPKRFEKFSTWRSLTCVVARLLHVAHSFRQGSGCKGWHIHGSPCSKEDKMSKNHYGTCCPARCLQGDIRTHQGGTDIPKQDPFYSLSPYIDALGLLRNGGRLSQANLDREATSHLILPRSSHVTTLLVRHCHEQVQHQGVFGPWTVVARRTRGGLASSKRWTVLFHV